MNLRDTNLRDMSQAPSLWRGSAPLVLASGSVTRRDMLLSAGVPIEIVRPAIDERAVEQSLLSGSDDAEAVAGGIARAKALAISAAHPARIVLGADQTLTCDGIAFHKPADADAARAQLAALSGKTHRLRSAFVLALHGDVVAEGVQRADLTMRTLTQDFISAYVEAEAEAAYSSVGGYRLEGLGAQLFERIEGDHFTILGLPLLAVLGALRDLDLLVS